MRLRPPQRYADEFYDLPPSILTVPSGVVGVKLAAWWKTARAEDQRDLLSKARVIGLERAFSNPKGARTTVSRHEIVEALGDLVETDEDDDDLDDESGDDLCPDEYGEDYV